MRCEPCPLSADVPCPSAGWAGYCGHARAEAGHPGHWTRKLLAEAGQPIPDPPAPAGPPGVVRMARTFVGSVATHLIGGLVATQPGRLAERERICGACPKFDGPGDRCRACGCKLSVKRAWAKMACPDGKWDAAT